MGPAEWLKVSVAYGEATRQTVVAVSVPAGADVQAAINAALPELRLAFPTVDFAALAVAVWGEPAAPAAALADDDRVELLQPLQADPKLARRSRVDAAARRKPPGSTFRR